MDGWMREREKRGWTMERREGREGRVERRVDGEKEKGRNEGDGYKRE